MEFVMKQLRVAEAELDSESNQVWRKGGRVPG